MSWTIAAIGIELESTAGLLLEDGTAMLPDNGFVVDAVAGGSWTVIPSVGE